MKTPSEIIADGERLQVANACRGTPKNPPPGIPSDMWKVYKLQMQAEAVRVGLDPKDFPNLSAV